MQERGRGIYKAALAVLALLYILSAFTPWGDYSLCVAAFVWFPAHWLVYKIVKVD